MTFNPSYLADCIMQQNAQKIASLMGICTARQQERAAVNNWAIIPKTDSELLTAFVDEIELQLDDVKSSNKDDRENSIMVAVEYILCAADLIQRGAFALTVDTLVGITHADLVEEVDYDNEDPNVGPDCRPWANIH